ncbi:hypothetical protein HOLleu_03384 [Holothuria leucospilota]|uniref:DUF6570 domain-containing protein n=1 Tax=Holothuria leucospilota TaxID=206669 RepID=A0A9Q1CQQ5_HOLLE|nr:hypothetical protein HOLleu_03384 [Holothuria leucospilota]
MKPGCATRKRQANDDENFNCKAPRTHASMEDTIMQNFHNIIQNGPTFLCSCCDQLWYKKRVQNARNCVSNFSTTVVPFARLNNNSSIDTWLCRICIKYLKLGELPPYSIANGVHFWPQPKELELYPLEERLAALRVPFMQIRELPRGGQYSLKGNVVNVPSDVSSVVTSLPRTVDDLQTIALKFKRKLEYKHSVMDQNVKPNKVIQAAKWLVDNIPLYKAEGITLNVVSPGKTVFKNSQGLAFQENNDPSTQSTHDDTVDDNHDSGMRESIENWTETPNYDNRAAGQLDTMLTPDFNEDVDNSIALCLAPCEGQKPLGLFQDVNSECLALSTLFCGKTRPANERKIHYSDICKVKDPRVAMSVSNIFYKVKKLQIQHIQQQVQLSIRKCKRDSKNLLLGI